MASPDRAFDAVVFDLDGVISDSERVTHAVWSETFSRYECSFTLEEWSSVVGTDRGSFDPVEALGLRSALALPTPEELTALVDQQIEEEIRGLAPLPGVREWLADADRLGLRVAVASSSPRSWVTSRLVDACLDDRFAVVSCRDDRLRAKPAPDVYLDACERLAVLPARAVAVEDSTNGIAAAIAAGLRCIAVRNENAHVLDAAAAHVVVRSLADLDLETALDQLARS
jgi:HAD superfamily hydrolase (TIGR01509 family)